MNSTGYIYCSLQHLKSMVTLLHSEDQHYFCILQTPLISECMGFYFMWHSVLLSHDTAIFIRIISLGVCGKCSISNSGMAKISSNSHSYRQYVATANLWLCLELGCCCFTLFTSQIKYAEILTVLWIWSQLIYLVAHVVLFITECDFWSEFTWANLVFNHVYLVVTL